MSWRYIAGFFDGEGSVLFRPDHAGIRVQISQSSKPVLDSIRGFLGIGRVVGFGKRNARWKESWAFLIDRQEDVVVFLRGILPFLFVKKGKAREGLKEALSVAGRKKIRAKYTKDIEDEVVKLRRGGLSYKKIGERLGKDHGYMRIVYLRALKKRGDIGVMVA